eukprot:2303125-Rhodomonas_salina.4
MRGTRKENHAPGLRVEVILLLLFCPASACGLDPCGAVPDVADRLGVDAVLLGHLKEHHSVSTCRPTNAKQSIMIRDSRIWETPRCSCSWRSRLPGRRAAA